MEKDITALINNYIEHNSYDVISEQSEYLNYAKRLHNIGILNTEEYVSYQKSLSHK